MATPVGQYSLLDSHNLIGIFDQMYEQEIAGSWAQQVGNLIASDLASETYGWLGAAPKLEELKGDMTEEQLAKFSYTLRNVEYAKSLKFAEKDLRRDKLGQINMRVGEMAQKAQDHWNVLTSTLISANGNGYDAVAFFATTHAESGTNQANALSVSQVASLDIASATSPTTAEAASALTGVLGTFFTYTDDKGDPVNGTARKFMVMVHTAAQWSAFNEAIYGKLAAGSENNVQALAGRNGLTIDLVLNPRLSALTTKFEVFRTDGVVKPFILQEEVPVDPQATDRNSDEFKKYRRFILSIYTSRAAGYGRWASAAQATFS